MMKGVSVDRLVPGRKAEAAKLLASTLENARFNNLTPETIQSDLARLKDEGRSTQLPTISAPRSARSSNGAIGVVVFAPCGARDSNPSVMVSPAFSGCSPLACVVDSCALRRDESPD